MIIAMLLVAIAMQAAQTPAPPPAPSPPELPVSIARIRAALERPDLLTLPQITPDFVVSVQERERFDKLVAPWDFRSGPVPPGGLYAYEQLQRSGLSTVQPLILVDLIAIARGIARAHSAQAAAAAREDVRQVIADYCAAQPGGGAGIAICVK
ncbi:MAG TPA: hypothetical protein VG222_18980 [Vicinamibacterales bacterium]|jgi:hypothetical protein|nr:hypothetical protein [Vicinamibacterales bacterium]